MKYGKATCQPWLCNLPHKALISSILDEIRHLVLSGASPSCFDLSNPPLSNKKLNSINPLGMSNELWIIPAESSAFSMMFFAIASSLSSEAIWKDSNSSCVWRSHKRNQMPEPAEATSQTPLHLHPSSFRRPNPMGIYLSCSAGFSPSQPCLHGSLDDGC